VTRQRSLRGTPRDADRLPHLQALNAEPPCWGYRRLWAYRRFVEPLPVHKTPLLRLMREHPLLVRPKRQLRAQRTPTRDTPRPTRPTAWWGSELTTVRVEGVGWGSIVLGLDWDTKKRVGYEAGGPGTARPWWEALDMAVNRPFPDGTRGPGVALMSDKGCQPTSLACLRAGAALASQQACTSDNNPQGNADTERGLRPRQEECRWRHAWTCPVMVVRALEAWMNDDNDHDWHAALGDQPPRHVEQAYDNRHSTPFVAA
jgi:hypothetical protein